MEDYFERLSALKVHIVVTHFVQPGPWYQMIFYGHKAQGQGTLWNAQVPASDLFEPQLHLIWAHLLTLRFKCCSECGSCKQRHEKHHRWRELSHGESCVHPPPTCTHCVWSKPHAFEVCMPLFRAKYGCVKNLACKWCHHLHTSTTNTHTYTQMHQIAQCSHPHTDWKLNGKMFLSLAHKYMPGKVLTVDSGHKVAKIHIFILKWITWVFCMRNQSLMNSENQQQTLLNSAECFSIAQLVNMDAKRKQAVLGGVSASCVSLAIG